jgi:hypothetical protein
MGFPLLIPYSTTSPPFRLTDSQVGVFGIPIFCSIHRFKNTLTFYIQMNNLKGQVIKNFFKK